MKTMLDSLPSPAVSQPLLQDDEAAEAWRAVDGIATELCRGFPEQPAIADLGGGDAGVALFFAYLDRALPGRGHDEVAGRFLERALERSEAAPMTTSLFAGITGIAWVLEHLQGHEPGEDANEDLDEALMRSLDTASWAGNWDLIQGLVGLGVYALERRHRPTGRACLRLVLDRLHELSEECADGVTWFMAPELLPPADRLEHPEGYYNLGMAHGVPGAVALLGRALGCGLGSDRDRRLYDGAARWTLRQRLTDDGPSQFGMLSDRMIPGSNPSPPQQTRAAWCYGDPGVAAALLLAARGAGDARTEREALSIALNAADRPPETCGVHDANLCHGTAGLAHIFHRIYRATGDERFAETARFWFRGTLALRQPSAEAPGGFRFLNRKSHGTDEPVMRRLAGFLTGSAGVGLALLAAVSPSLPDWDRPLLLDLPGALDLPGTPARDTG